MVIQFLNSETNRWKANERRKRMDFNINIIRRLRDWLYTCADPESFVRGGPILAFFF